jgi:type III pantothenate kinase
MLLAINIGNSNMRFVLLDGTVTIASIRLRSDRTRTGDEIAGTFAGALDSQGRGNLLRDASGVIVSSVVPILSDAIREMCSRCLPDIPPPVFISGAMNIGMEVRYDPPQSLGADRLVNAYAARELHGRGPLIVADYGTATTFDVVDASGAFVGGAILPGIGLGRDALAEKTAQLPRVDLFSPEPIPGYRAANGRCASVGYPSRGGGAVRGDGRASAGGIGRPGRTGHRDRGTGRSRRTALAGDRYR